MIRILKLCFRVSLLSNYSATLDEVMKIFFIFLQAAYHIMAPHLAVKFVSLSLFCVWLNRNLFSVHNNLVIVAIKFYLLIAGSTLSHFERLLWRVWIFDNFSSILQQSLLNITSIESSLSLHTLNTIQWLFFNISGLSSLFRKLLGVYLFNDCRLCQFYLVINRFNLLDLHISDDLF